MNTSTLIIILAVVVAACAVGFWLYQRRRTARLRQRFGPEYDRVLAACGSRWKCEAELENRARRVEQLHIRMLSAPDVVRFAERWRLIQAKFLNDPAGSVEEANTLAREVLQAQGYPVGDFEQRAADISVDHPHVVENYRLARETARRNQRGLANTEDLRKSMLHYRALFDELLQPEELSVAS